MKNWIRRHFSDNVQAQKNILIVGSAIGAVGVILFAVAFVLLVRAGGLPLHHSHC
ncbi:hypothetical protein [Ramlibacter sp.]|uniref:hypothetical protein n=1 Tax=Ramlibacter sp. TaxID=1917967 RepID=UPI002612127E|nr:hypothetical protein [Ramlibacter sp.]MDB5956444.1 hypothetical protein [Ramlibacter sp.]